MTGMQLGSNTSKDFEEFLNKLHIKVAKLVADDSTALYGKKLSVENTTDYLSPLVKPPSADTSYAPTFAAKINHELKDDISKVNIPIFDVDRAPIEANALVKDTVAVAVVSVPYVHIAKATKLFTIRCETLRVLVIQKAKPKNEFNFDMSDEVVASAMKKRKLSDSEVHSDDGNTAATAGFDEEAITAEA